VTAPILACATALIATVEISLASVAPRAGSPDANTVAPRRPQKHSDAGTGAAPLSDEDREVLENLELLQHLDDWRDLDLLLELSKSG
jgi:hypothetical protein